MIIFSNLSFGKEFRELFEINHRIENGISTENSLNKSFDKMIYRLSGSKSPSNIWKIINSGSARKDFIESYSVHEMNGVSYLKTKFNQNLLEETFKKLDLPIIGKSRPTFIVVAKIDNGVDDPYFISDVAKNTLDGGIQANLKNIASERGVFIDLPSIDLIDLKKLSEFNYLINPTEYLISKYKHDRIFNIAITKVDLEKWTITGDLNLDIEAKEYQSNLTTALSKYIEENISDHLSTLKFSFKSKEKFQLNIDKIDNFDDYQEVIFSLKEIMGIEKININRFNQNILICDVYFYGEDDRFITALTNKSNFVISEINQEKQKIYIEYKG